MNPQDYMQRLAGLSPVPPVQQTPGYWWNDKRVPETKPYGERFAGGQNKASFSPFQGDITRYGFGPQHRYYQADPQTFISTTTGTNTTTASATDTSYSGQGAGQGGGPDGGGQNDARGSGRDQASFASFSEMMNDPGFRGDWGKVAGMMSPAGSLVRDLITGNDPINGNAGMGAANTGMNNAGGVPNPELAGRSDPSQSGNGDPSASPGGGVNANDLGAELAAGNTTGNFAEGGVVPGDQVQGQDDVTINADGGEGVIRAKPMTTLGEPFLDALNTEDYALAYKLLGEIVQQSQRDRTEQAIVAKRRSPPQ